MEPLAHEQVHEKEPEQTNDGSGASGKSGKRKKTDADTAAKAAATTSEGSLSDAGRRSLARQSGQSGDAAGVQKLAGKGDVGKDKAGKGEPGKDEPGKETGKDEAGQGDGGTSPAAGAAPASGKKGEKKAADGGAPGAGKDGAGKGDKAAKAPGGKADGKKADDAAGGGGDAPATPDVDMIAREYAFHEAWQQIPETQRNEIVTTMGAGGGGGGDASLSLADREKLLNQSLGRGMGEGVLGAAKGVALSMLFKQGAKLAVKKGAAKALPFVGLAFAGWDLYGKIAGNKIGESWDVLNDPNASEIDKKIARLVIIKDIVGILSAVLGVASGVCTVIAALTSWTLVGGVSFGAAAAVLFGISVALELAAVGIDFAIMQLKRQKVLTMEGDPEAILAAVADYEATVASVTGGAIGGGIKARTAYKDIRGLQTKTRTDAETTISQDKVKASASGTTVKTYDGKGGSPSSVTQNQTRVYAESHLRARQQTSTVTSQNLFGKGKTPQLESLQQSNEMSYSLMVRGRSRTASVARTDAGPTTAASVSHQSVSASASRTEITHRSSSQSVVGRSGYDMRNPANAELRGDDTIPLLGDEAKGLVPGISLTAKSGDEILARNEGELPTTDPNTVYKLDGAGKGTLERRLPLSPMPVPPYVLPEVMSRARTLSGLSQKEAMLAGLLQQSKQVETNLDQQAGPGGDAAQWEKLHEAMSGQLEGQRQALAAKEGKVQTAEGLVGKMEAEDQKAKGKTDEALKSREVEAAGNAANNTFLRGVVSGGATVAKAGAAVVNFVGGLFGKKEPVIDTRAIDKVKSLFTQAPKVKSGKSNLGSKRGDLGSAAETARKPIADKKKKLAKGKAKHAAAQGGTQKFAGEIAKGKGAIVQNQGEQKAWVVKVQKELAEVRAAKAQETAAFNAEMGMMQTWAVQHYQSRQLNAAVMQSAHQPPSRSELTQENLGQIAEAESAVDGTIAMLEGKKGELAGVKAEALNRVQSESGMACGGSYAAGIDKALGAFGGKLDVHKASLAAAKASLATVNPDQLAAALDAVGKTVRAIRVSVVEHYNVHAKTIGELSDEAIRANMLEQRKKAIAMSV